MQRSFFLIAYFHFLRSETVLITVIEEFTSTETAVVGKSIDNQGWISNTGNSVGICNGRNVLGLF